MITELSAWLESKGMPEQYLALSHGVIGVLCLFFISLICFYLTKYYILEFFKRWVSKTQNSWDDLLAEHHVFSRLALLVPIVIILTLTPSLIDKNETLQSIIITLTKVALCFQAASCISAILNVIKNTYLDKATKKYLPLNATIQILKLSVYLVATILAIALVVDRSPLYLLSGLGALTAVLLLVFQDTIKGLVASIQISANKMLAPGDWIEMPSYGADGDVLEIGLSTVKVRNFDNTITTVPTYALISNSFKNWRGMLESPGRRIKRAVIIDMRSIEFCSNEQLTKFKKIAVIKGYLNEKIAEIESNQHKLLASDDKAQPVNMIDSDEVNLSVNQRKLTNLGTFRAYIERYLNAHPAINQNMTCMVRQLPPTSDGIPLELYCFSKEQNWKKYEGIQADIFDHVFAIAPEFDLRIFQHPSGHDWQNAMRS